MADRTLLGRRRTPPRPVVWAARGLAASRIALGVALVAAPGAATTRWLGTRTEDDPGREVAVRGLGARDVVLGIGTLVALRSGSEVRHAARWVEAGIVADLADAAATAVAEDLDAPRSFPLALALGAAAFGAGLRSRLR
ncbi:MAG: hypothetical protein WEB03_02590 [Nitriliruptor sp.]|uniref:hypothetical protein n=1 Tax=Nitriliruptor sp. TaxID=2448056 RepID=UPI00349FEFA4